MSPAPVRVAVIGAGEISEQYLTNLTAYPDIAVLAIADLDTDPAKARGDQIGIERRDRSTWPSATMV